MKNSIKIFLALFFVVIASYGQAPTITSFAPISGVVGSSVVITGTNFSTTSSNNIVYFGPTKATVTLASATSLTVTVPVGANYSPITVINKENSLVCDSKYSFMPTFQPSKQSMIANDINSPITLSTITTQSQGPAIGDLDGDGKADIAVANGTSGYSKLSVYRNIATPGSITSGSFATRQDFPGDLTATYLAMGDLDGDGLKDIVVCNGGNTKTISVYRNNSTVGNISFESKINYNVGANCTAVALGDLNGDGKLDIVVANYDSTLGSISIFQNNCLPNSSFTSTSFPSRVDITAASSTGMVFVNIADMNADGKPDIITTNNLGPTLTFFRNAITPGNAIDSNSFQNISTIFTNTTLIRPISIGDLNNDGKPDLAISDWNNNLVILQNNTVNGANTLTLGSRVNILATTNPFSNAIGDLDGDGKPDIVVVNTNANVISIFRSLISSGTITTSSFDYIANYNTGAHPSYISISDMDGDGKPDLIVQNFLDATISIFRNDPKFSISLSSAIGTDAQVKCVNTAITQIAYSIVGTASVLVTGLPSGVTYSWSNSAVTINGTPTVPGIYNYTVALTGVGTLGTITATGTITVNKNTIALTSATGTNAQTLCINTPITSIQYATTGATGATFSGLPTGVTGSWSNNVVTISGTPTQSGTFSYTVTLTGGCSTVTATGTITVTANNTITLSSAAGTNAQYKCVNSAITNITYTTSVATGATFSGLPPGVTGSWSANVVTISGTPTAAGIYNYIVTLTGGCGTISASGSLYINNTIRLTSVAGTDNQSVCKSTAITNIQYTTTSATGATFSGLPTGVTGSWSANVVTISGTPTVTGTYTYTITLTGGCTAATPTTISGTINVDNTITLSSGTNSTNACINTAMTPIVYNTTKATGATFSGLPPGVTGSWSANVVTISGTPTQLGTFPYTITLTGGCTGTTVTASGSIIVNSILTPSVSISSPVVCEGTAATFTATPTNGGTAPTYQWKVNGTNVGTNSDTYTSSTLVNGDVVTVEMTSNATPCLSYALATSNAVTMTVNPNLPASVSITASATTICSGTSVTFTATPTYGGTTPMYQWKVNGANIGANSATYTSTTLANNDVVTVVMTSNASPCLTGSPATSNAVTMTVNPNLTPSVSLAASATTICPGTSVTFTATPTNGGTAPTYQWKVNGTDVSGQTAATFTTATLANNDVVTVVMTSNATPCLTASSATSNSITMIVNSLATASITNSNNLICPGSNAEFEISGTNGAVVVYSINSGATSNVTLTGGNATITVNSPVGDQTITLVSVSANGCTTTLGTTYTIGSVTTTYDNGTWSNGAPNAYKTVVFNSNYTISDDFFACAIYVASGAVVTVQSGYNVFINGEINVASGGNFILNNNSNLLQTNPSAINSGNITVKRNTSAIIRLDHTLWSSPVVGQKLFSFSPYTLTNRFYSFNSATNSYTNTTTNPGLFDANSEFSPTNGYAIRAPNNYYSTISSQWTGTFVGVPNNGTKQFPLAYTPGAANYNLVGNPFPSPIDADMFYAVNASKIEGTIYFYQHTLKMDANGVFPAGTNYASWNETGATSATAGALNLTPNDPPNGIIQVGQGFFVKSKASGSLEFTNAMRVGDQNHQFLRTYNAITTEKHRLWLNLVTDTGVDINQILVGYITNASQGFDSQYDGLLYGNTGSYLYSMVNGNKLAIQGRAVPFDTTDEVPLGLYCETAGTYSIKLSNSDGLFLGSQDVFIRDNLTGTDTNIKNGPYTFSSGVGVFENRFKIVYSQALGVPSNTFDDHSVIVYKDTDWLHVSTKGIVMKDIMVYDVSGRLIYKLNDINDTTSVLKGLSQTQQVLFVKVISQENQAVTVKVIH